MSKKSEQLKQRWPRIKMRDSLTSQTAFEDNHWTLPEGFVGFFAYHFEVSCHKDIANLKDLINDMDFGRGCKEPNNSNKWCFDDKVIFLLEEIDHWDSRKYWSMGVLTIITAFAAAIGSGVDSSSSIQKQLAFIKKRLWLRAQMGRQQLHWKMSQRQRQIQAAFR